MLPSEILPIFFGAQKRPCLRTVITLTLDYEPSSNQRRGFETNVINFGWVVALIPAPG